MTESLRTDLAKGLSAVLPASWEFTAELNDAMECFGIDMGNQSCKAYLELLGHGKQSPKEFISSNLFHLMRTLADIGVKFQEPNNDRAFEIIASKEDLSGKIIHIYIPESPVVHISGITQTQSDLDEIRCISNSIAIDKVLEFEENEGIVPLQLTSGWQAL